LWIERLKRERKLINNVWEKVRHIYTFIKKFAPVCEKLNESMYVKAAIKGDVQLANKVRNTEILS